MPAPDRIVMFHGTTSAFLDRILADGLSPTPPARLSTLMMQEPGGHTTSFDGVYVTTMPHLASHYAKKAAELLGGEPIIVTAVVPVRDLIPDEDEILYHLNHAIASAVGWDLDFDDNAQKLNRWSREAAREAVRWVLREDTHEHYPDDALDAAADALNDMMAVAIAITKRGPEWLFDPECGDADGWCSPRWVRALTATPEGMALYRDGMDRLSKAFRGAAPRDYPCGTEGCKGRLLDPVGLATGGAFIVGVGTPEDMFEHNDARDLLDGVKIAGDAELWLETRASQRPAMAMGG